MITNTAIALMLPMTVQIISIAFKAVNNVEEYALQLPQIGLHRLSESQKKSSRHLKVL